MVGLGGGWHLTCFPGLACSSAVSWFSDSGESRFAAVLFRNPARPRQRPASSRSQKRKPRPKPGRTVRVVRSRYARPAVRPPPRSASTPGSSPSSPERRDATPSSLPAGRVGRYAGHVLRGASQAAGAGRDRLPIGRRVACGSSPSVQAHDVPIAGELALGDRPLPQAGEDARTIAKRSPCHGRTSRCFHSRFALCG